MDENTKHIVASAVSRDIIPISYGFQMSTKIYGLCCQALSRFDELRPKIEP